MILLAPIALLALGLRLYHLGTDSFWLDEAFSVVISQGDDLQHIIELTNSDIHPPLYYLILHFFLKLPGAVEVSARLMSVVFGVLTVLAIYYVGARLLDKRTALVASFLCAVSLVGIAYSQEARMYAMVAFLGAIEMYALYMAVKENRWTSWVLFITSAVLIMYTHYYGCVWTAALAVYGFVALLRENAEKRSLKVGVGLRNLIISLALIFLIFFPQLLVAIHQSSSDMANSEVHPNNLLFFPKIFYFLTVGGIKDPMTWMTIAMAVAFLALAAAGFLASLAPGNRKNRDVLLFFTVVMALSSIAGFALTYKVRFCGYRYFLFLLAPFLLMVAYGITSVPPLLLGKLQGAYEKKGKVPRALKDHAGTCVLTSIVLLMLLVSSLGICSYGSLYSGTYVDLRDAMQYVKDNAKPGDHMVVLNSDPISRDFYAGYLGMDSYLVDLGGDQEKLKGAVPGDVQWVLVSDDSDWPENGQVRPWLDEHMKLKANMTLISVYAAK